MGKNAASRAIREVTRTFRIDVALSFGDNDPFAPVAAFRGIPLENAAGEPLVVQASTLAPGLREVEPCTVTSRLDLVDLLVRAQSQVVDVRSDPSGHDLLVDVEIGAGFDADVFMRAIENVVAEVVGSQEVGDIQDAPE